MLAELSWWFPDASATHQSPDRDANGLFQFPRVENYQHQPQWAPLRALSVPSSRRGWQADGGETAATRSQHPKNYFSYSRAKAERLKALLVPRCLPLTGSSNPWPACQGVSYMWLPGKHRAHERSKHRSMTPGSHQTYMFDRGRLSASGGGVSQSNDLKRYL